MIKRTFKVCTTCSEIVIQGYSDAIEDGTVHQKLCNKIDKELLPEGYYWIGSSFGTEHDAFKPCDACGKVADKLITVMACKQ